MKSYLLYCLLLCTTLFAQQKGTFTDTRDGKTYKTVKIGEQVWMAENLNYEVEDSKCYGEGDQVSVSYDKKTDALIYATLSNAEIQANCDKYGRLYDWNTAKTVCPLRWHLPSKAEWEILIETVGGSGKAGKYLKTVSGWNVSKYIRWDGVTWWGDDCRGKSNNGTDAYGFSALPGGFGRYGGSFGYVGGNGNWWSSSEDLDFGIYIYTISMSCKDGLPYSNSLREYLLSVRCLKN